MFFPTDITHLRFTRSNEADDINGHLPPLDDRTRTKSFVHDAASATSDAIRRINARM